MARVVHPLAGQADTLVLGVLLVPGHTVDRFVVVRLLGEGGLARVYLVKHRKLGSEHALKLLHVNGERAKARFLQEGQVQARIRHANIVPVTDVVEVDQAIGLVMDFVDGPSLAEILTGEDALSRRDIPGLFDQICQGVSAAHAAGVLHRDLKPANILIAVSNFGVQARITDFGIAKAAADFRDQGKSLTEAGTFMGTLGYMAPEQLSDAKAVDVRADVFSLGCVVYEMLAGKSPYARRDRGDTIRATLSGEHKPIADAVPGLPKALAAAIERAIHPVASQRFDTVDALRLAVGQAFRGYQTEPVEADLPPVPPAPDAAKSAASAPVKSTPASPPTVVRPTRPAHPASSAVPARTDPTDESPVQNSGPTVIPEDLSSPPQPTAVPGTWAGPERQAVVTSRGKLAESTAAPRADVERPRVDTGKPLLDFRRNRGPGIGSWLALGAAILVVGSGLLGLMAHEQAGVIATADANAAAGAAALERPWALADARLIEAIRQSPNRAGLNEAAVAFAQAPTVEKRIGKARELVRAVRSDIGARAAAGGAESTRLQVASGALDPIELAVENAEKTLALAIAARTDWITPIADLAGWTQPDSTPGQTPLSPISAPAAFAATTIP